MQQKTNHLTAKDFDTDDVNATLAELAPKLQLTADETELLDSIMMLYGSKSQNGSCRLVMLHTRKGCSCAPWLQCALSV